MNTDVLNYSIKGEREEHIEEMYKIAVACFVVIGVPGAGLAFTLPLIIF